MANLIVAQMLFLESENPDKDASVHQLLGVRNGGAAIYDTMQFIRCDVLTMCVGHAASMGPCCWRRARPVSASLCPTLGS